MDINQPIMAAHAILEATRNANRVNSRARINNERTFREKPPVNDSLTNIEAHLRYVSTKELENARRAELMKIARAHQPGLVSTIVANLRVSVGTMLVTVGERLQAKHDALEAERLHQRRARAV